MAEEGEQIQANVENSPEDSRVELIKKFIDQGLELLKEKRYAEAMDYFLNKKIAGKAGFELEVGTSIRLGKEPVTEEEIETCLYKISLNGHCWSGLKGSKEQPFLQLGSAYIVKVKNTFESRFFRQKPKVIVYTPQVLMPDIALGWTEEWLHGLQIILKDDLNPDVRERLIDTEADINEIDVALYMQRKGVLLTAPFLERYNRAKYLKLFSSPVDNFPSQGTSQESN